MCSFSLPLQECKHNLKKRTKAFSSCNAKLSASPTTNPLNKFIVATARVRALFSWKPTRAWRHAFRTYFRMRFSCHLVCSFLSATHIPISDDCCGNYILTKNNSCSSSSVHARSTTVPAGGPGEVLMKKNKYKNNTQSVPSTSSNGAETYVTLHTFALKLVPWWKCNQGRCYAPNPIKCEFRSSLIGVAGKKMSRWLSGFLWQFAECVSGANSDLSTERSAERRRLVDPIALHLRSGIECDDRVWCGATWVQD